MPYANFLKLHLFNPYVKLKWRKVPPLKTRKICYCGGNITTMTTLTVMLTLQHPHDAKPDPTRPSRSKFGWKITTNRTVEDFEVAWADHAQRLTNPWKTIFTGVLADFGV